MTLVELTMALALSAMLLAGLVGLLRGLYQQTKISESYEADVWPARFVSLVQTDLSSAESLWVEDRVIWMSHGFGGQDMRHVGYRCRQLDTGLSVLERLDRFGASALAIGPTRVEMERIDRRGAPQPIPNRPGPVPAQVRIWVWEHQAKESTIARDLVLR